MAKLTQSIAVLLALIVGASTASAQALDQLRRDTDTGTTFDGSSGRRPGGLDIDVDKSVRTPPPVSGRPVDTSSGTTGGYSVGGSTSTTGGYSVGGSTGTSRGSSSSK
ncbi:MAG: hypothetical protein HYT78_08305 [Deltaproteobacteria bacterium]|nr:hypothetical protein [Deltaproteobacteria bacterium]